MSPSRARWKASVATSVRSAGRVVTHSITGAPSGRSTMRLTRPMTCSVAGGLLSHALPGRRTQAARSLPRSGAIRCPVLAWPWYRRAMSARSGAAGTDTYVSGAASANSATDSETGTSPCDQYAKSPHSRMMESSDRATTEAANSQPMRTRGRGRRRSSGSRGPRSEFGCSSADAEDGAAGSLEAMA